MNRYTALILALLMALLCVLPVSLAEETATAETEATEAPAAVEDQVLATFADGTQVMQSEVDAIANQIISYYANYGYDMSAEDSLPIVRQMAMETYLQEAFYADSLVKLGLDQLTEEDTAAIEKNVDDVYEGLIEQVYTYYGLEPAEDATEEDKASARASAIAMLDSMGYTRDYIVLNETESYNYDKVTKALTADLSVSEEDLLASYNSHVEDDKAAYADDPGLYEQSKSYYGEEPFFIPEGFRGITHILLKVDSDLLSTYQDLQSRYEEYAEPVDAAQATPEAEAAASEEPAVTEEPVTEEQVEAARQAVIASVQPTIDEIMSKLAAGTPWADLVAEYSTDPGMSQEPYKTNGYEVYADSSVYDPAFVQAAFSIDNVGDVSAPYVGMYGIYIVHYTRDVPAGPVELTEELRASLENELLSTQQNEALDAAFTAWQNTAGIEYTEAGATYRPESSESLDDAAAIGE